MRSAHAIVNDVDAFACGLTLQGLLQILIFIVDAEIGAMLLGDLKLFRRLCEGDHPGTHQFCDLDGGMAGAAGGAEDRNGLSLPQASAILQPVQGRPVGDGNAGRCVIAYPLGDGHSGYGLYRQFFAATIAADKGEDTLAEAET